MIGAVLGYEVELVMPENASEERKKRLLAHGARIVFTDPMLGYDESLYEVKRRYEADPDKYFWCDQYSNQNNPLAHYETTAEEILSQAADVTHFVAGRRHGRYDQRCGQATQGARFRDRGRGYQPAGVAGSRGPEAPGRGPYRAGDVPRGVR